jgi:hypothetical protein
VARITCNWGLGICSIHMNVKGSVQIVSEASCWEVVKRIPIIHARQTCCSDFVCIRQALECDRIAC